MAEDDQLMADFMAEAGEIFAQAEDHLLRLEQGDAAAVQAVFRAVHTIKGNSSFLGLMEINHLAHELESLLDDLRQGRRAVSAEIMDCLLAGIDRLRTGIASQPAPVVVDDLIERVIVLRGASTAKLPAQPRPTVPVTMAPARPLRSFAEYLVQHGLVPMAAVLRGLMAQDREALHPIEALQRHAHLDEAQAIAALLHAHAAHLHPVAAAQDVGLIDAAQAARVLAACVAARPPLTRILVAQGACTAEQAQEWLQAYLGSNTATTAAAG